MSKFGRTLIASLKEAIAIAEGRMAPGRVRTFTDEELAEHRARTAEDPAAARRDPASA